MSLVIFLLVGSLSISSALSSAAPARRALLQDTTPAPVDSDDEKGMGQGIANLLDKITSPTPGPTAGPEVRAPHKSLSAGISEFVQNIVPAPDSDAEPQEVQLPKAADRQIERAQRAQEKAQAHADAVHEHAEAVQSRTQGRVGSSAVATPRLGALSGETLGATIAGTGLVAALLGAALLTYRRRNQKLEQGQSRRLLVSVGSGYAKYGALDTEDPADLEATPLLHDDNDTV